MATLSAPVAASARSTVAATARAASSVEERFSCTTLSSSRAAGWSISTANSRSAGTPLLSKRHRTGIQKAAESLSPCTKTMGGTASSAAAAATEGPPPTIPQRAVVSAAMPMPRPVRVQRVMGPSSTICVVEERAPPDLGNHPHRPDGVQHRLRPAILHMRGKVVLLPALGPTELSARIEGLTEQKRGSSQ